MKSKEQMFMENIGNNIHKHIQGCENLHVASKGQLRHAQFFPPEQPSSQLPFHPQALDQQQSQWFSFPSQLQPKEQNVRNAELYSLQTYPMHHHHLAHSSETSSSTAVSGSTITQQQQQQRQSHVAVTPSSNIPALLSDTGFREHAA